MDVDGEDTGVNGSPVIDVTEDDGDKPVDHTGEEESDEELVQPVPPSPFSNGASPEMLPISPADTPVSMPRGGRCSPWTPCVSQKKRKSR